MGATVATRITAEEYFAIPALERRGTQLIDGMVVMNEPLMEHSLAQIILIGELYAWTTRASGRGLVLSPLDLTVTEYDVYAPDLAWLREERVPDPVRGPLEGLPDLAVEIRSPSTWRRVLGAKKPRYEAAGLPELWLVDPQQRSVVICRRLSPGEARFDVELELSGSDELASPLLPGFGLAVARLFERP